MHKSFSIRPLSTLSRVYHCFPLRLFTLHPSYLEFATPWASSSFSATSFDSCSFQLTHLYSVNPFHCENVVLQFTFPLPLPSCRPSFLFLSISFLCFFVVSLFVSLPLFLPPFPLLLSFFFMHRSRTFYLLAFSFFSLSLHQRNLLLQVSFLSLYSRLNIAVARTFSKSNCLTSGYLIPLINSRYKSLRFGLFHGTRPSLEARKIEWSFLLSWVDR